MRAARAIRAVPSGLTPPPPLYYRLLVDAGHPALANVSPLNASLDVRRYRTAIPRPVCRYLFTRRRRLGIVPGPYRRSGDYLLRKGPWKLAHFLLDITPVSANIADMKFHYLTIAVLAAIIVLVAVYGNSFPLE